MGRHYLRDIFEEKDMMKNPSLNLSLLCLVLKYLDLILWDLSFELHWRVDVHEWASNHHGLRSFVRALALSFFVSSRDHGSRRNISENVQFPAKIQHAPKSRTKSKTVKFGCQVAG